MNETLDQVRGKILECKVASTAKQNVNALRNSTVNIAKDRFESENVYDESQKKSDALPGGWGERIIRFNKQYKRVPDEDRNASTTWQISDENV